MIFKVNWIPLLISTILSMGLGALWYSNVLFAKPWMKESGVTEKDINNTEGMGKVYAFTALGALLSSYVIGFLVVNIACESIVKAILLAIMVWAGTNIPPIIKNWGFENRTIKLGIINHGYDLVIYIIVAILFSIF